MAQNDTNKNGNGGNLGFEADMFKAADKLRGNMEPSDYKHVALGLIFLKYISDAFEARHKALLAEDAHAAEDKDEYLADNVFWVPKEARWSHLQANANAFKKSSCWCRCNFDRPNVHQSGVSQLHLRRETLANLPCILVRCQ